MPVPPYQKFIFPLLQFLGEHPSGVSSRDAHSAMAEYFGLSKEDREQLLPSGRQRLYQNRNNWAHDRLKRARLSNSVARGVWCLTREGQTFLAAHPHGLSDEELLKLTAVSADSKASHDGEILSSAPVVETGGLPPDEQIDAAIQEIRDSLVEELLQIIQDDSPEAFERLVLDVLVAMGYGTSELDAAQLGKSGDGGIDGVIRLDRLGLEKVYIQAKRWKQGNTVGRPEIQAFYGALAGRRASKGVFITASTFSKEAHAFAEDVSNSIILVDGAMLARLMIDYRVGVSVRRTVHVVAIDTDYFEELGG
jgi:restriction system protein